LPLPVRPQIATCCPALIDSDTPVNTGLKFVVGLQVRIS
jgi:hypothetical protein